MAENNFDNYFKDKLQNHASSVPEGLWERIEAAQDKKRRGLFWWKNPLAIGALFAIIAAGVWLSWPNGNENEPTSTYSKSNTINVKESNTFNNEISKRNNGSKESLNEIEKTSETNTQVNGLEENHVQTSKETAGIQNREIQNGNNFSQSKPGSKITTTKTQFDVNNLENSNLVSINQGQKSIKDLTVKNGIKGLELDKPRLDDNTETLLQSERQEIKDALSLLAKTEKNLSKTTISPELLNSLNFKGIQDCPSAFGQAMNNWYLELFASPDYAIKSTDSRNASLSYFNAKDSTETFQGAFTAGVRISKTLGKNLMFKSGLQYSQINEKFKYRSESERRLITVVTIRTIIRSPGDTITVRDTSIVEQIGYKQRTTFNRYRTVDIPILLGYEWGNSKWKTNVTAGVILNVRSWQQGEILDTSFAPMSFNKGSSSIFKQNIGLGLYGGFSLLRSLNERTDIFAEPYIRYNLSNMARDKSPYNQKFTLTGINFGIRYKLNYQKPLN